MTIDSPAALMVQNGVAPGREAAFDAWYLADHMPDRLAAPGFCRARRWRAIEGGPRDLSLYELDGLEALTSPAYLARLAEPTQDTRRNMDAFVGMTRSACRVEHAVGFADGGFAALLPLMDAPAGALPASKGWQPDPGAGVVARAVLRADPGLSRTDTVESRLRREADRYVAAAAWIEAASAEQAAAALAAARTAFRAAGLDAGTPVLLRLVAAFGKPGS